MLYIDKDGKEKLTTVIHRSSIGAIERIMAFLIEKYEGNFPLWLSPVQVKVIPVRENHNAMSRTVLDMLVEKGIRVELDDSDENLGTKVRDVKENKIPYWVVIGDKEIESGKVTLESRDDGSLGQISSEELLSKLQKKIKEKK